MKVLEWIAPQSFVRSVGVLLGGTGLSAAIGVLVLPILTRLYTPADFAALAAFVGVVATLAVSACLRFELAIPLSEDDAIAINVLALATLSTTLISIALVPVMLALPFLWEHHPAYLWLTPLGILFAGCYSALTFWTLRRKAFSLVARNRVGQAVASASAQFALSPFGPLGLVIGAIAKDAGGCIGLSLRLVNADRPALAHVSWAGMRAAFATYERFPKYSAIEALANSASMQVPIIMIAALAGTEAGYLLLALSVVQAPLGLLGNAVAQVYLARAPEELRANRLEQFTREVLAGLVKTGIAPLVLGAALAPLLFPYVFGAQWHRSGVLLAWMTPWIVMQLLVSPIGMALHVTGHQRAAMILQLSGLAWRVGMVAAAWSFGFGLSEAHAVSGFGFYCAYLGVVLWAVRGR